MELISQLHPAEMAAVIFGLIYVVLAAKENVWCWFWGILSCSFWAWATFNLYDLWIDAGLQIFYVGVSFFGVWQWLFGNNNSSKPLNISTLKPHNHVIIIIGGLIISFAVGKFFATYTPAASTYLDAFTTVFSIIATFMVVRKILENWIYWIVVDAVYVYIYFTRDSVLFTGLMVIYTLIAIYGWIEWRKNYRLQKS